MLAGQMSALNLISKAVLESGESGYKRFGVHCSMGCVFHKVIDGQLVYAYPDCQYYFTKELKVKSPAHNTLKKWPYSSKRLRWKVLLCPIRPAVGALSRTLKRR